MCAAPGRHRPRLPWPDRLAICLASSRRGLVLALIRPRQHLPRCFAPLVKTIAMHAAPDAAAMLGHLADCGYDYGLHLLYTGRQPESDATVALLGLFPR
ncbi:hypothetical protein ZWY2020_018486 [Hordeum vulgare]|nr:hypothetical protein ZWY2020_018486 [Hordeum vulgare]